MRQLKKIFGLIILITFLGCNLKNNNASYDMLEEDLVEINPKKKNNFEVERKLIKEGSVEFETININTTRKTIFDAVEKFNGYISSDQEYKTPGRITNTIIIRVPAMDFDNLLKYATEGITRFDLKEIEVKDVTEEFLDIQARLKTKKELENRYLELLTKAKSVTEILEVEKQIGELRSDIESIEGRLNYLENKVSFSTLTMTFYQKIPNEIEFGNKFKTGLKNGWDNLIWFLVFLTNIWPFILLGIATIFGIRIWRKKKKEK